MPLLGDPTSPQTISILPSRHSSTSDSPGEHCLSTIWHSPKWRNRQNCFSQHDEYPTCLSPDQTQNPKLCSKLSTSTLPGQIHQFKNELNNIAEYDNKSWSTAQDHVSGQLDSETGITPGIVRDNIDVNMPDSTNFPQCIVVTSSFIPYFQNQRNCISGSQQNSLYKHESIKIQNET